MSKLRFCHPAAPLLKATQVTETAVDNGFVPTSIGHPKSDARSASARRTTCMPEKRTIERAREDAREGKAPSTQAGEFVREEIDHVREGKHGVRNPKQAIAIGLSKARKAGVNIPPPPRASSSARKSKKKTGRKRNGTTSRKRSQATTRALKREGRSGASRSALSRQAKSAARARSKKSRSASARKAASTRKAA